MVTFVKLIIPFHQRENGFIILVIIWNILSACFFSTKNVIEELFFKQLDSINQFFLSDFLTSPVSRQIGHQESTQITFIALFWVILRNISGPGELYIPKKYRHKRKLSYMVPG